MLRGAIINIMGKQKNNVKKMGKNCLIDKNCLELQRGQVVLREVDNKIRRKYICMGNS